MECTTQQRVAFDCMIVVDLDKKSPVPRLVGKRGLWAIACHSSVGSVLILQQRPEKEAFTMHTDECTIHCNRCD